MATIGQLLFKPLPPLASATASLCAAMVVAPSPLAAMAYMTGEGSWALGVYAVCLGLGLPAYALLLWKKWLSWWHYALAGLVASAIGALAVSAYLVLSESGTKTLSIDRVAPVVAGSLVIACFQGLLVSVLAWPIVRRSSPVLASALWGKNAA